MSFESILGRIVEECGGGLGAALMERDGIPIVQVKSRTSSDNPLGEDLSAAGAEFSRILGEIHKASDSLAGGSLNEVVISLSRFVLIFREIDEDIVLVVAIEPDGNLGKARYLMRRYLPELVENL